MTIAYLMTHYPAVSHTFIRREILELERRGHSIVRFAIRPADAPPPDPLDREEQTKTLQCLAQPVSRLLLAQLQTILRRPAGYLRAIALTVKMGWKSDRGLIRHFAYLIEAGYLMEALRNHPVDHVHAHFGTNATAVARLMRRMGGPTYSFTVHGIDLFDAPKQLDVCGKVTDAAFVVAVCDFSGAQLRRWTPCAEWSKIHVVRCGVGDGFLGVEDAANGNAKILVSVGRLSPEKGQILLVEAFGEVIRRGEDARLVLVGDGELRPVIERRIKELGLTGSVTITGFVGEAEVRRQIRAARGLVLPSFAEGLPMVIMEALALGRPVISTYVAGIPELVRPGENGWLVPAGNAAELASAMCQALQTPVESLRAMGARGRDQVRGQHHLGTEVAKLEALLQQVVTGKTA